MFETELAIILTTRLECTQMASKEPEHKLIDFFKSGLAGLLLQLDQDVQSGAWLRFWFSDASYLAVP